MTAAPVKLVVLDRDGVLNRMLVRAPGEPPDSPLDPAEVEILPGVPSLLRRLGEAGFRLAVASNQPAAAKGKASRAALEAVHARVLAGVEVAGARIASSHVCYHRAEDGCACRKPRPGLLEAALAAAGCAGWTEPPPSSSPSSLSPPSPPSSSSSSSSRTVHRLAPPWMVGDRATDVLAGAALGFATALLGGGGGAHGGVAAPWPDDEALLRARQIEPSFRGIDLQDFVSFLLGDPAP